MKRLPVERPLRLDKPVTDGGPGTHESLAATVPLERVALARMERTALVAGTGLSAAERRVVVGRLVGCSLSELGGKSADNALQRAERSWPREVPDDRRRPSATAGGHGKMVACSRKSYGRGKQQNTSSATTRRQRATRRSLLHKEHRSMWSF